MGKVIYERVGTSAFRVELWLMASSATGTVEVDLISKLI